MFSNLWAIMQKETPTYWHIRKQRGNEAESRPVLTWKQRTKIAIDAAKGLEYLHNKIQPAVVHKNVRTSNILLFEGYTAKIGDIEVFSNASDTDLLRPHSTHVLGTSGYNAPEQIMTGLMTKKSDVYSFGVVLLELLTGKMPIDYSIPKQSLICWATKLLSENKVQECIDPKLNNDYPLSEAVKMAEIAVQCVQFEPWYRPTMTEIVQDLSPLLANSTLFQLS
ncbi:Kinase superfamily protein [Rhynchospora pubera]|uniref:Kinase superfamily protein n=1 Tax=Rhynchospora pubera TaxID=906938 RepID=A0AAV8FIH5_9POAL|nr:Kinase superfamily protein [Rhynchospora pubera]